MKKFVLAVSGIIVVVLLLLGTAAWRDYDADYKPYILTLKATDFVASTLADSGAAQGAIGIASDSLIAKSIADTKNGGVRTFFTPLNVTTSATGASIGGWRVRSLNNQIITQIPFPDDADPHFGIAVRVLWTSTAAGAVGSIRYTVNIASTAPNVALKAVHAGADSIVTALNDSCAGALRYCISKWDTIGVASTKYYSGKFLQIGIRVNALGTAVSDSTFILGAQLAYIPKLTQGLGYRFKTIDVVAPVILSQAKGCVITGTP